MKEKRHYPDEVKERSEFWQDVKKLGKELGRDMNYSPTKEATWLIRRDMPRNPRDGRR